MPSQFFLGVDGGQSSTMAALCDHRGRLLGMGTAGPSNHVHEPGGLQRLESALRHSIQAAFERAGYPAGSSLPEIEAAFFGMTGGVEQTPAVLPSICTIRALRVEYDIVSAHAGALAGGPGVIVIAGTGSVAYGVNSQGESARAGGWAYIMGDEGSGYDLGRQALIAAARAADGRGPESRLLPMLLEHFQQADLWQVRQMLYAGQIDRKAIAGLARLVVQAAQAGDQAANAILAQAAGELCDLARAILSRLSLKGSEAVVSPVGGVFQAGDAILAPFREGLQAFDPAVRIRPPIYQPVIGALVLALKMAGIGLDEDLHHNLALANQKTGYKGSEK